MSRIGRPLTRFSHSHVLAALAILLLSNFVTSQPVRQGPFQVRLHYEPEYNWQQDNLVFGTSYCWSCSGSGADVGFSTVPATKLLEKGNAKDEAATKTRCKKGDTVWVAPCDKKDRKQLFQFEQIDTLPQVDGHTSPLGFFKVAGTELCLTDDRAENCGFDDTDIDYEEKKCYTLQKCATARKKEEDLEFSPGSSVPEEAMYRDSTGGGSRFPNLPPVASKQLFVGFNPTAPTFEIHIYSLRGYSATQGINYRKCVSNHHHPKPRELIYAQGCDVARRTDSSYWKVWGETCTPYASCGMCEGACNTHKDCEGELECYQRDGDEVVPGCDDSTRGVLKSGQNYCYDPGEGIRLTLVGDAVGSSSLYECEADCDYDSDCVGDLKCYFRSAFEPVPGCKGQGIIGRDYCYHYLRGELDGDGNEAPRITRSPTQQPTTAKPTPHPTLRKRQKESQRPRDYTNYDDSLTDNFSTVNRAHGNPFGNGDEDEDQIVGGGDGTKTDDIGRDPPQFATFQLVRNFNCYIRQCSLCEGSCENDGDCAGDLVCCRRDEFGEDAINGLGCAGKSQHGANYCYHNRPNAELAIVRDSGANCGPGQCTACQGDCDDDSECAGNLKCFQRQAFEPVPGCTGRGIERRDYCYKTPDTAATEENADNVVDEAIGNVEILGGDGQDLDPPVDEVEAIADEKLAKLTDEHYYCQKVPCGLCEGDCNDSTQCSGDLVCIHREGYEPMDRLGCSGKGVRGWDYCVDQLLVDRRTARYDGTNEKWWALP